MPFDQVLLPLLGGYFFVSRFNGTAYIFSAYSGYRILMSSAFAGVGLSLVSATVVELIQRSEDFYVLHNILIAPTCVGLMFLMFGAWKSRKSLSRDTPNYETDTDEDFRERNREREVKHAIAVILFVLSSVSFVVVATHAVTNNLLTYVPKFAGSVLLLSIAAAWTTFFVKRKSEMHGFQVALRLGAIAVVACILFLASFTNRDQIAQLWQDVVPFKFAGTALLAMILGVVAVYPGNWLFPYRAAINRLSENKRLGGIENLFYYAGVTFQQVILGLRDGKVYVGYVDGEVPVAGRTDDYVAIVPTASGYRKDPSRKLELTTFYLGPFREAIESKGVDLVMADLAKVIPISEVTMAGVFDPDLYSAFQKGCAKSKKP